MEEEEEEEQARLCRPRRCLRLGLGSSSLLLRTSRSSTTTTTSNSNCSSRCLPSILGRERRRSTRCWARSRPWNRRRRRWRWSIPWRRSKEGDKVEEKNYHHKKTPLHTHTPRLVSVSLPQTSTLSCIQNIRLEKKKTIAASFFLCKNQFGLCFSEKSGRERERQESRLRKKDEKLHFFSFRRSKSDVVFSNLGLC